MEELSSAGQGRGRWLPVLLMALLVALAAASLSAGESGNADSTPALVDEHERTAEEPSLPEVVASPDHPRPLIVSARPDLPAGFEQELTELPAVTAVFVSHREIVRMGGAWSANGESLVDLASGWVVPMQAATVDPAFPQLPPALSGLRPGDVVWAETAANRRRIGPGGSVELNGVMFDVTAVVPDEVAGSAEILLTTADGADMDLGRRFLTVQHEGDEDELEELIRGLLPDDVDGRVRAVDGDPRFFQTRSRNLPEMKERFGEFAHGPVGSDGRFTQDTEWRDANITTERVPILGSITCHREFIPLVAGALGELEELGLAHLINPSDYAGCWASRLVGGSTSISKHAWGAAIDLNASANGHGQDPTLDHRVVVIFERWGMRWGGNFPTPDGMHFEWSFDPIE